jgi:sigma-B regulation protein RsbU (phosphoserine phosphatase)
MVTTDFFARSVEAVEAERLRALHRYAILDTPPDEAFNRIARVAARSLDKPVASITFVDSDRIWFKAIHGVDGPIEIPRDAGLCTLAIRDHRTYLVRDTATDPYVSHNLSLTDRFGIRFYAAAPITTADGHQLGTVSVLDTSPGDVSDEQLATLEDLAAIVMNELELRQSALTTVRAERELRDAAERNRATMHEYAAVLQRALLPSALPTIPGLSMAAHYHPVASGQVGGDFYDVFGVAPDRWAFFLGDVEGHGAPAAAVTALVRHTLRAAALHYDDPTEGLRELNTALIGDPGERRFCTVLSGSLRPASEGFRVTLATGGHLPALLLDAASGSVRPVRSAGGMLIGAVADATFEACETLLRPGQTLLLYTDGIVEARPDGTTTFGEPALRLFLSERVGLPADMLVAELAELAATLGPDDDVAFLALSADPTDRGRVG